MLMRISTRVAAALFLGLLAAALPSGASADLQVYPLRVELARDQKAAILRVKNLGDAAMRLQSSALAWTQTPDGDEVQEPTGELLIFPRIVEVPAGVEQVFRIGFRGAPGRLERAFRLRIEEIPSQPRQPGLTFALAMSVPVFVAPRDGAPRRSLSVTVAEVRDGALSVTLANRGNVHERPEALTVRLLSGNGAVLAELDGRIWYILAGIEKSFAVPMPQRHCRSAARAAYSIRFGDDREPLEGAVALGDKSACR